MSELIDEGSYGCTFTPPLPCLQTKQDKSGKKREVGKIIKKKNAQIEISIATLIRGIPGWERYYILQEKDACDSANFQRLRETYESKCKIYKKSRDTDLLQLLSPYGGKALYELALGPSFDFVRSFEHVLEGIERLGNQGICHFDLHEGNILVDYNGTFRIIDFGAAFQGDSINTENIWRHTYGFEPSYPPLPPEVAIQNGLNQHLPFTQCVVELMKQKRILKTKEYLLGISLEKQEEEIRTFWAEDTLWKGQGWEEFFKVYWRKWDVWSVGVMFLGILQKLLLQPHFIQKVWIKNSGTLRTVLKGCLEVDPRRRLMPADALRILKTAGAAEATVL